MNRRINSGLTKPNIKSEQIEKKIDNKSKMNHVENSRSFNVENSRPIEKIETKITRPKRGQKINNLDKNLRSKQKQGGEIQMVTTKNKNSKLLNMANHSKPKIYNSTNIIEHTNEDFGMNLNDADSHNSQYVNDTNNVSNSFEKSDKNDGIEKEVHCQNASILYKPDQSNAGPL